MTNTERLISELNKSNCAGLDHFDFYVGKYTGNGPSVVGALRRRGYTVEKLAQKNGYRLTAKS